MRPNHPVSLAWLCAAGGSAHSQSTAKVWLPGYDDSDWSALRGSIISSDASVTAYTVFCAQQAPSCQIAGDLPFIFTEGAHTLLYGGADPGTLTEDIHCTLTGTTAATCTGSTSLGPDQWQGTLTGPTSTVWTRTYRAAGTSAGTAGGAASTAASATGGAAASDADASGAGRVTWGVLTLTTPGPLPATTDIINDGGDGDGEGDGDGDGGVEASDGVASGTAAPTAGTGATSGAGRLCLGRGLGSDEGRGVLFVVLGVVVVLLV